MLLKVFWSASVNYFCEFSKLETRRFIKHLPISTLIDILVKNFLSVCTKLYCYLPRFVVFIVIFHSYYPKAHLMSTLHEIVVWWCGLCPEIHQRFVFHRQTFNLIWLYLFEENLSCILDCLCFILTNVGIVYSLIYYVIFLAKFSSYLVPHFIDVEVTFGNLTLILLLY